MAYTFTIIGICILALFGVGIWLLIRGIRRRKAKGKPSEQVPQDITEDLEYCERRLKETNGTATPQQILWELARRRTDIRTAERATEASNSTARDTKVSEQPSRVQPVDNERDARDEVRDEGRAEHSNRRLRRIT